MGLARPPELARVTLQHARILPAARCSHPTRQLEASKRVAGKSGPRHPETRRPSSAAGGTRCGRFLGRRGAQPEGRCAQRTSLSFWPRLSERSARRARSEFCGPTLGRQRRLRRGSQLREALVMPEPTPQGSRTRSADRPSMSLRRVPPAATRANASATTGQGQRTSAMGRKRPVDLASAKANPYQPAAGSSSAVAGDTAAAAAPRVLWGRAEVSDHHRGAARKPASGSVARHNGFDAFHLPVKCATERTVQPLGRNLKSVEPNKNHVMEDVAPTVVRQFRCMDH